MTILPFGYYIEKDQVWCPFCTKFITTKGRLERKICKGGWFRNCPKNEHFHRRCHLCNAIWVETTNLASEQTIEGIAIEALNKLPEANLKSILEKVVIKGIMEE